MKQTINSFFLLCGVPYRYTLVMQEKAQGANARGGQLVKATSDTS
jgi:hypothetical protein